MGQSDPNKGAETVQLETCLESEPEKQREIRDGGYAWVIALTSFMAFSIFGAFMRCEGIYYVMFLSRYKGSAQTTAWLGAIASTLQSFTAPLATMLVNRFSVRTSVMLAAMLSSLGYFLTAFATDIYWLFFTYSVLQGLSRCLTLTPAFICVSMYFHQRRGQALAFATSGAAFGALFIVPLTQWLRDTYQFQGAFLISSGIAMHGLVCAFLFRPFSLHEKFNKRMAWPPQVEKYDSLGTSTQKVLNPHLVSDWDSKISEKDPDGNWREMYDNSDVTHQYKTDDSGGKSHEASYQLLNSSTSHDNKSPGISSPRQGREKNGYSPLNSSKDDLERGCCSLFETISLREILHKFTEYCSDAISVCFAVDSYDKSHATKSKIFHVSIFNHSPFLLMCFSMIFTSLGNETVWNFLPALCLERGLNDADICFVISAAQIADIFGKLSVGYLMDLSSLRRFQTINLALLSFSGAGLSLVLPLLGDVQMFSVVAGLYSFLTGAMMNQRTVVLTTSVDGEVLSSCFGVLYAFQGVGSLIGPPLSGAMKDIYGDYRYTYVFSGISLVISGCLITSCLAMVSLKNRTESTTEGGRSPYTRDYDKACLFCRCFSGDTIRPAVCEKVDVCSIVRSVGERSRSKSPSRPESGSLAWNSRLGKHGCSHASRCEQKKHEEGET